MAAAVVPARHEVPPRAAGRRARIEGKHRPRDRDVVCGLEGRAELVADGGGGAQPGGYELVRVDGDDPLAVVQRLVHGRADIGHDALLTRELARVDQSHGHPRICRNLGATGAAGWGGREEGARGRGGETGAAGWT